MNIYSNGYSFGNVRDAYVRVCGVGKSQFAAGHEMASFKLDSKQKSRGIIFCRFVRHGAAWSFDALAWGCDGKEAISDDTVKVCEGKKNPTSS